MLRPVSISSALLILVCSVVAVNARAAGQVVLDGHSVDAVGQADLTIVPGPPPAVQVSLLTAGDGLSVGIGPGGGGIHWDPLPDPATLPEGPGLGLSVEGRIGGLPNQTIATVDLDVIPGGVGIQADLPNLGSPPVRVELYLDGSLVRVLHSPTTLRANAFPTGFELRRRAVPFDAGGLRCTGGAGFVPDPSVTLTFDSPTQLLYGISKRGGNDDLIDTLVFIFALAAGGDPDVTIRTVMAVTRSTSFAGSLAGFMAAQFRSRPDDQGLLGFGTALLGASDDGVPVANLAGCRQAGVRVDVDDDALKCDAEIDEVILKLGGTECMDVDLVGDMGGSVQVLGSAHVEFVAGSIEITSDLSPVGVTDRAFYYNDGQLVAVPPPGSPNRALESRMPTRIGGFFADSDNFGFRFRWNGPVVFQAPFGGTVMVDEIHVTAASPTPALSVSAMDMFFGSAGVTDDITITGDGITGLRPPIGAEWSRISALGGSYVSGGGGGLVLVRSDPSDESAGVRFDMLSEPNLLQVQWASLGTTADQDPNASVTIDPLIRPFGLPPRSMGTAKLANDDPNVTLTIDYSPMQSNSSLVLVYDDGVLVSSVPGVANGVVASAGPNAIVCAARAQTFPSTAMPHGFSFEFSDDVSISITSSKSPVVGDEILVLAEFPIAPLVGVLSWSMRTTSIPWLMLLDITSNPATAAPAAWLARPELRVAPNPFNPRTTLRFELPLGGPTSVRVYSLNGRLVDTIHHGWLEAGLHSIPWSARDRYGTAISSGVYLLRVDSPTGVTTARVTLLK